MDDKIQVALIAVSGVLISSLLSYLVSHRQAKLKIKESMHSYSSSLFLKRFETYPVLYSELSRLAKSAIDFSITEESVKLTLHRIHKWDSENILFVGEENLYHILELEDLLRRILQSPTEIGPIECEEIVTKVLEIESSLKLELGVYSITEFQNVELKLKERGANKALQTTSASRRV